MQIKNMSISHPESSKRSCQACNADKPLGIEFEYAFQPIVDISSRTIFAHEALIRGPNNESAYSILAQVNDNNRYQFDQACRMAAVKAAATLNMKEMLSINFLPQAVYSPKACIRTTLEACAKYGFSEKQIIFEVYEGEKVEDEQHLVSIFESYKELGFKTAIDDFGAGYSGLNLLSKFQPDIVKIDINLIRDIEQIKAKRAIVAGIIATCKQLDILVLAEGVETKAERDCLIDLGIELMQGYYFCRPAFKALGEINPDNWR